MTIAPATQPRTFRQLIAGEWVGADEGRTFDDLNPFNGQVFARVPASGAGEAQRAIEAAHQAIPAWAAMGARARQALLEAAAASTPLGRWPM